MKLLPEQPDFDDEVLAESRPPLRLRVLVGGVTALLVGFAVVGALDGQVAPIVLGTVSATAAVLLLAKLCTAVVLAGPGWLAERRLGSWARIPLDRHVTMRSSSSPLVGGDWLFLRHDTGALVMLWSQYAGARELLDAVRDDYLIHCPADQATEDRLWPDGRPTRTGYAGA